MIIRPKINQFAILFTLKGSIAKRIALRALMVTLLAAGIVLVEILHPSSFTKVSATPFTLLGLSLSIFMSFRNNACYDRWYEARKAWGEVIVHTRSVMRETQVIRQSVHRRPLLLNLCGFAHSLNARLRRESEAVASAAWITPKLDAEVPDYSGRILHQIGEQCGDLQQSGELSEWRYMLLANHLTSLTQAQAVCDRIKNTPLPFPYTLLLHRTIYLFCILLPFAMAEPLGWLTPLFTAIVSYTFFGLDAIADELEDPFGRDENDLPTDALVRTIERDILFELGETELPPVLMPVDYVLS
ncbi:bestrophin family protein [Pseudomonas sp. B2M1-30]|uniref:bestrophin family protein n=1 Tax=Pseudomonas TaxID=286 RepID=UPI0021CA745E|nr:MULTISPECIES: bestrophin family protein [Pseudomonas]MCU0119916.1 bestrophin family protein [Pseudomonas sp. B2M1-30]MCU7261927.1 bestrophin family protein [Pseudomonas koreensis]